MSRTLSLSLFFSLFFTASHAQVPLHAAPEKLSDVKMVKAGKTGDAQNLATDNLADSAIKIKIITDSGTMIVRLYDSTPLHRDNFVKLVKAGFYDSLLFHRVIKGFMIQGGDPGSRNAPPTKTLGDGGDDMARIPAEFRTTLFHKKGVLAAARDNNPEKASSACQFYLVEGKTWTDDQLDDIEKRTGRTIPPDQRLAYKTIGGTPHLDGSYTVFGEVIDGIDVIDKIAHVPTGPGDRPIGDIHMRMEIIK